MDPRLSYLHASEHRYDEELVRVFNPVINLSETFNSLTAADENCHLKVFLRVRPYLPGEEKEEKEQPQVSIEDVNTVLLTAPSTSNTFKNSTHGITKLTNKFTFSHIYGPSTSQLQLYECTTKPMVTQFIQGQNCLLFTYGATNSGKTYTVQGGGGSEQGILPRMLASLFRSINGALYPHRDLHLQHQSNLVSLSPREIQMEEEKREALLRPGCDSTLSRSTSSLNSTGGEPSSAASLDIFDESNNGKEPTDSSELIAAEEGMLYAVFVSFAEIYNETIYDLLERLPPGCNKRNPHMLGEDRNGVSFIKGLYDVRVDSASEALRVLEVGRRNLHFATTRLNHNSSRSHCIFTVKLIHLASADMPKYARVSKFSICDLAGAERVAKTQGCGERLKEAGNINTSLLVLSRCIVALRQNQVSQRTVLESTNNTTVGGGTNNTTVSGTNNTTAGGGRRREVPVPYRDSKLTRLLQGFFLGQGVAAMIVNISQSPALFDETLQVLKFSAIAKRVITCQEQPVHSFDAAVRKSSAGGQLTRLIRQSLNKSYRQRGQRSSVSLLHGRDSRSVGRLSVPWLENSVNVTFGEENHEDPNMLAVPEEADEEEEDDDEQMKALLEHMQKLTDALARVNQEKKDLEVRLRSQLCSEFSKQMIEVENNWRQRLDDQKARSDEHHDWQIARLTEFYSSGAQPCKRARPDDTNSSALEDSILQFRQSRLEELESQLNDVQEKLASRDAQVETLTATLKKSSEGGRKAQEEITKLQFQLATLTNSYDQLQRKLEHSEKIAESAVPETEALLGLQKQVAELEEAQQQLNADLHDSREMLVEAANAYALKEEEVSSLSCEVVSLRQALAEQATLLEQAQEELSGAQELASERTRALEERESAVEDMQLQLSNTREIVRQLRQKLKASEERIAELAAEKQEAENALVRDKSKLLVEMAEMKNQLTGYVASPGLPKKVLQLQKANKDFQDQLCANQLELKRLQGENQSATERIQELEKDFCNIHSELKERDSQLADKNKILDETVRSLQEKEEIISDLQIKIGANINETKRLGHLINEKEEKINVLLSQLQEANGEIARLSEKGPTDENEVAARELSGHELRARLDAAIERAAEASRQLDVMREKYEDLETSAGASNEQMVASFRRYEEKCLELDAIKRQFTGHPIDISNKDSALIDARTKISQLEALLQEKSEKLLRMENIKNENKRLSSSQKSGVFQQESTRESHLSNILERLEEELENSEAKCENLTQVNRSLLKENLEYEQKHATEREKLLKQLEEAKKVHISATRYKDCELASAKKESEDARHQAAKLREENAAVEKELAMQAAELESLSSKHDSLVTKQQNLEQEYNSLLTERDSLVTERDRLVTERDSLVTERDRLVTERDSLVTERDRLVTEREKLVTERDDLIAELDRKVSECNAIIHGKESELTILSHKIEAGIGEKKVFSDEVDRLNSSLLENKEKVAILHERISSLQEQLQKATATHDAKLTAMEEERQKLLDALLEAQGNSKSAADVDSEKLFKLKDELKRSKESCQILQKEMTAVREARALQVQEMSDLRAQLYKLQQASSSKDEEIISLQNEVKKALASHVMPSTAVVASPAPAKIKLEPSCEEMLKEQLRAKDVVVCDLLAQLSLARDQSADTTTAASVSSPPACETPFLAPPSSSAHKVTKVATRSESDSSFASTPAASEKKKRGRPKTLQVPCLQEATSLSSSTRRSTRRTRACVAFTAMDTDEDNASNTEEESPAGSYSSSRRGRRGTASNRRTTHTKKPRERLVNPHLESNKENRISMANKYESVSEALDAAKSMPKSTRGRRRRQLYEEDVDQPLYCSPQLIEPMPPVDSPHTAVRRHLKAQPK